MRVLITGGFGYLGGRIAKNLVDQGFQIVLGSRNEQAAPDWLPKVEIVRIDWDDQSSLENICKNIDVVVHTAGMNAQECAEDPVAALEFNGIATGRLVQASVSVGVTKFIYLSTAHVYSYPLMGEIDEESCLTNRHPYATSHVAGENAVLYQSDVSSDFAGIVLRLSNGIGVPAHKYTNCWMLAVNDFCKQVVENGKIVVNSSSKVERDFVPISLLCNSIHTMIDDVEVNSGIINIASSNTVSLQEITNIIKERTELLFGFSVEVMFKNKSGFSLDSSNSKKLFISNHKLKETVEVEIKLVGEIDQLLLMCRKWFG
jgi:UDP-glucose 4-epimerase